MFGKCWLCRQTMVTHLSIPNTWFGLNSHTGHCGLNRLFEIWEGSEKEKKSFANIFIFKKAKGWVSVPNYFKRDRTLAASHARCLSLAKFWINKWIIPREFVRIVEKDHPSNVEFPGYFKGAVIREPWRVLNAFFPLLMKKTKNVVLEALSQSSFLAWRDIIGIQWLDRQRRHLNCTATDEFVDSLNKVLGGQVDKREAGYKVAESRFDRQWHQLVEA